MPRGMSNAPHSGALYLHPRNPQGIALPQVSACRLLPASVTCLKVSTTPTRLMTATLDAQARSLVDREAALVKREKDLDDREREHTSRSKELADLRGLLEGI